MRASMRLARVVLCGGLMALFACPSTGGLHVIIEGGLIGGQRVDRIELSVSPEGSAEPAAVELVEGEDLRSTPLRVNILSGPRIAAGTLVHVLARAYSEGTAVAAAAGSATLGGRGGSWLTLRLSPLLPEPASDGGAGGPQSCDDERPCAAGVCTKGVCCDRACDGPCEQCDLGACVVSPAGSAGLPSCAPFVCTGESAECGLRCQTEAECAATHWCLNATCVPRAGLGAPCSGDAMCLSGFCVDGVCCDTRCDGQCDACDLEAGGRCMPAPATSPGKPSCAPYRCSGVGATCRTTCAGDGDCGASAFCGGGVCQQKQLDGTACADARQCASDSCSDGVCCDKPCDGACDACDRPEAKGTCLPAPARSIGRPACSPYVCDGVQVGCPSACGPTANTCVDGLACTVGICPGPFTALRDDFNDAARDANLWTAPQVCCGGAARALERGGRLEISLTPGPDGGLAGYRSARPYDLRDGGVSVRLVGVGAPELTATFMLRRDGRFVVRDGASVSFELAGGTLRALATNDAGSYSASTSYSPSAMQYLRIRESGGDVVWEVSADGGAYTLLGQTRPRFNLAGLFLELSGGSLDPVPTDAGVLFDDVNVP